MLNPRTLAILAIVFAVISLAGYAGNWVLRKQVRADLARTQATYQYTGDAAIDASQHVRLRGEIEASQATSDRASLLLWIGMGAVILAAWSNTFRVRLKRKLAQDSTNHGGGTAGHQPPIATGP